MNILSVRSYKNKLFTNDYSKKNNNTFQNNKL